MNIITGKVVMCHCFSVLGNSYLPLSIQLQLIPNNVSSLKARISVQCQSTDINMNNMDHLAHIYLQL